MLWLFLLPAARSHAYLLDVRIDASRLSGEDGVFVIDLIPGDAGLANSATLSNFETDADLFGSTSFGGVSGQPTTTLLFETTDFFNSLEQELTFGTFIRFSLEISEGDSSGGIPDRLSIYLFDVFFDALVTTSDPTGANSLFGVDFTGDIGGLAVYAATADPFVTWSVTAPVVTPVPEPHGLLLLIPGLALLLGARRARPLRH